MDLYKILGIGIISTVILIIIKQVKPEFTTFVIITTVCIIFSILLQYIADIYNVFDNIITKTGINKELFVIILKIIGVGYLVEFSANICADAGNVSVADKIVLAGKLIILTISMPIVMHLFDAILELVQWRYF